MTMYPFMFDTVDPSWLPQLKQALLKLERSYLEHLVHSTNWLPGPEKIFNAFSLPVNQTQYVLFGESPYPRLSSANGYAFWDEAVQEIWSAQGFTKTVNRATSLRNILKMLLVAEGALSPHLLSQEAIAQLDKSHYVQTGAQLFNQFLKKGFLLLNATPVLQEGKVASDALNWRGFMVEILSFLLKKRPDVTFLLFGRIARHIADLLQSPILASYQVKQVHAEHPYNLSFIHNPKIISFFKPLHLLRI